MGWKIVLDGQQTCDLGKLPVDFFEQLANEEGIDYWDLYYQHPARTVARFNAFLDGCVAHFGITKPVFEDMDAFQEFTNDREKLVQPGEPIAEEPMEMGFPTEPGNETPADTSSSGSPEITAGPQQS